VRGGVHAQYALAVVLQVIVPGEEVLGEGVEVEGVARLVFLAQVLEGHGKARLAGAVVGEDENSLFLLLTQILRQRIEVGKGLDIIIFCHSLIQLLRK